MINNTNYIFLNTYLKYDVFDVPDAPLSQNSEAKILFVATDVSTYAQFTDTIEKIIQALELDIERDVVIHLVQPNDKFNIPAIHATYGCRYYLLFGNLAQQFGLRLSPQKNTPFYIQDIVIVLTDSLHQLALQPALKRPLWDCLKSLLTK